MSNRSSHFVQSDLPSLTSALAGVPGPRRLTALAAVLALLVLALLPTTGQAQSDTTPPALASATVLGRRHHHHPRLRRGFDYET